jgi:hypothetical protein
MTRPDPETLKNLGENVTNVANAWGGARDYLSRGLKAWARDAIGGDRALAVKAALATCKLVVPMYPSEPGPGLPPRGYIDGMVAMIQRWIEDPSQKHTELVRSSLDVTREMHAWQRDEDVAPYWILDAVDHASLAVWAGERSSYIVPMDFATCAARSIACVLHAMLDTGEAEKTATARVVDAVEAITGATPVR